MITIFWGGNFSLLQIYYFVVPNTTSQSDAMLSLHPGQAIKLSCLSSGIPQPVLIWFRDGIRLANGVANTSIVTIGNMSQLTVADTHGQKGGQYICNGTNVVGSSALIFIVECKLKVKNILPYILNRKMIAILGKCIGTLIIQSAKMHGVYN